ncbi:MAG: hypothetical protein ABWZ80_01570 [Beijerinckiaceae bacterium]
MLPRPVSSKRTLPKLVAALMVGTALAYGTASYAPAAAQTTTIERLNFGPPQMAVSIPKVDVEGSSLTQGELTTLFQFKDAQSIVDVLGRLNAKAVRIPEIRVEQNLPAGDGKAVRQLTIYRDLTLTDISAGKARALAVSGGTMDMDDPTLGKTAGTFGRISVEDADFTAMARFFVDKATGDEAPKVIYRNGLFDGMSMKGAKFELTVGRMAFGEFRARPLKRGLLPIFDLIARAEKAKGEPADPQHMRDILNFIVDMFEAFESSPATVDGLKVAASDEKNRPINATVGKITIGAFTKLRYPSLTAENLKVEAPDGSFTLASASFKGTDLAPVAAGIREAEGQDFETWISANWRKLIPSFDGFALAGMNIDVPDAKNPGQRIKAKLGDFDVTLGAYMQGIPTNISTRLRNVVFDIPANTTEKGLKDILALGYRTLDVSGAIQAKWDENSKTISFDNVSVQSAAMGGVNVKATIGNAIKELFVGDPTMMQIAAMGLTAKDLEIKVDNAGLIDKLIAQEARRQNKKPEDFRRDMGAMANVIIPGVLGGGEAAQTVANAVSAFIAKPISLLVAAKSKDPAGLSIGEAAMASGNPLALIPKLNISAKAN